nr:hypothetical protein [Tanacetum cinerariifolium]
MNNERPQSLPGFDSTCYSSKENYVPCVAKPNFVDESSNIFNPPPQPPIYYCEFSRSNAQYGHYCTPQAPFNNPEPGYSQDFNFPQDIYDFQQQYLCCDQYGGPHETFQSQQVVFHELCCENCEGPHENFQCQPLNYCEPNPSYDSYYSGFDHFSDLHPQQYHCCDTCGGLHETFQCQPINQNFYNPNSLGFDQTQAPQFPVIHPPPHEASIKILHDQETVFEIKDALGTKQYKPEDIQELFRQLLNDVQIIHEELAEYINSLGWNRPAFYDDDDDDDVDYTIAITPVLSTEETDNSLSMRDEHLDTISATESDKVIKSSVEDLVSIPSESEGIPDTMCDVHLVNNPTPLEAKDHFEIDINFNDDISSSDDDSLYKENIEYVKASPYDSELQAREKHRYIEALKDNPAPSSEFLTKSSSTYPKSFLEETNTFHNSLPEFENFCFNLEEINSGSTTTHFDISLSEYDLFIFDLTNDQFPPTDRSDFANGEFVDELAHIISPPEYNCFYFWNLPDPGELMFILNFGIHENLSSTTRMNLPVEDDHSPLLTYIVWIFLAYLTYPVIPPFLHSFENEDTIFNPGITINRVYSFKPGLSHRCEAFKKFNTHRSHLNEWPMIINGKNTHILDVLLFHFYPP